MGSGKFGGSGREPARRCHDDAAGATSAGRADRAQLADWIDSAAGKQEVGPAWPMALDSHRNDRHNHELFCWALKEGSEGAPLCPRLGRLTFCPTGRRGAFLASSQSARPGSARLGGSLSPTCRLEFGAERDTGAAPFGSRRQLGPSSARDSAAMVGRRLAGGWRLRSAQLGRFRRPANGDSNVGGGSDDGDDGDDDEIEYANSHEKRSECWSASREPRRLRL